GRRHSSDLSQLPSSRPSLIGAKLGTGLALFPLLPTVGWEKVPEGRMRAGARMRDGFDSGTTAPLCVAALIRRFAPPSPAQERGRRGSLRRKLAPMSEGRDDGRCERSLEWCRPTGYTAPRCP